MMFKKQGVSGIQSPNKQNPAGLRYFASGNDDGLHAVYPNIKLCSLSVQRFTVPKTKTCNGGMVGGTYEGEPCESAVS